MRQYLADIAEYGSLSGDDELRLLAAIERGATAQAELAALGPDSPSSARESLRDKVAKGQEAQQTLTRSNLRLVVDIARDYEQPTARSLLALVQEGNLGLLRAIETFDSRTGSSFRDHVVSAVRDALSSSTE
jgi:RNA polymerase primary sigma factor